MREIEVKIRTKDLKRVERELAKQGCVLSAPIHQHDVIYSPKGTVNQWEQAKEGDVILRIRRQDGNKAIFTLKKQRTNELDNIEIETEVSDPDALHQTLLLLGCAPVVEVNKVRRKGRFKDYEICLDEVEKLGTFVELEKIADDDADPEQVAEGLYSTLASLGLSRSDEEKRGYDTQRYTLEHKSK